MKRKQIIVLGLVLIIISVGILQYNYGKTGEASSVSNTDNLAKGTEMDEIPGAAVYVNNSNSNASIDVNSSTDAINDSILKAQKATGYFAEARMERDKARSKQKEELKSVLDTKDASVAASLTITAAEAQEQLVAVIKRSEIETTIETLIKQKGFEDAIAYMSDTGNIDIVVKAQSLSAKEVAQISDIVVRHADVTMEKISIKNDN